MRDAFGTQIEPLTTLGYAVRNSTTLELKRIVVMEVFDDHVVGYDPDDVAQRSKTIRAEKNCVSLAGDSAVNI